MNEPHTEQSHTDKQDDVSKRPRFVVIPVNTEPVRFEKKDELTGLEVKETAIDQGVDIKVDFVLTVVHAGGHSRQVGDSDTVKITENIEFFAIPDDDNS
ncbi:MAG: multiubiquitin domain-containing protein [Actinobacteria bacterium]|nr:multiubiquitin domain-containing protein [Actinomycetota bacterium]